MQRRDFLKCTAACAATSAIPAVLRAAESPAPAARPNILWITAEDFSTHLGCYGDGYAVTPNLDALARQGTRFTNAYATAPVCSPARSCLATGMYATSLGTQRLRSAFPVPPHVRCYAAYLRQAGYWCSNNVKTDYNMRGEKAFIADSWDECSPSAHWRNRPAGRPFFAVFNLMTSHQSRTSVWPGEQFEKEVASRLPPGARHDPARANLPPFYPDTPLARQAWARCYDCGTVMDAEAGEILRALEADGLAQNTIVFFYGDGGMGMPRGKRCLHDAGLRVPLLVQVPEKFTSLLPTPPGGVTDRLVSFVDFAPTVLGLCGVEVLPHMQGRAFLGPKAGPPRKYVYGARDRVDEAFDVARSVRDGRFLYIRNFMPHLPWMQPERYSDASPFRQELKRLAAEGKLGEGPMTYAAPRRALEELYDTESDPHQVRNLASSAEHRDVLLRMRAALRKWIMETRDAGFLTETQVWHRIGESSTPLEMAREDARYPLAHLLEAAEMVGRQDAVDAQVRLLADADDGIRYWAAVGLHAAGQAAAPAAEAIQKALEDKSAVVRVEAASALLALDNPGPALAVLEKDLLGGPAEVSLHAARALELAGEKARPAFAAMQKALTHARTNEKANEIYMFVRFSLEAALEREEPRV